MYQPEYISQEVRDKSALILEKIKNSKSILMHCHPSPDPDSVGSALAMKFALEKMGKKATVIRGDSEMSQGFKMFPGIDEIVAKNYFEIDKSEFDLFLILDSGGKRMISAKDEVTFPEKLFTIVIDHHASNDGYANINLIDKTSPAAAHVVYQLLRTWSVELTREIAINLFVGMYTDTGGFKYPPSDFRVILAAADCAEIAPDYTKVIFDMENSHIKENIYFLALALNSIETFYGDSIAISSVSNQELIKKNIPAQVIVGSEVANILKSVVGWNIGVLMTEVEPQKIRINFRSRNSEKFDVSKVATALGGGGHRAAAGAGFIGTIEEAKKLVVSKIGELYNLS